MNKIKYILPVIFFMLVYNPISAQEMTLEQCRTMALKNNKQISIANQNKEKATSTIKAYRSNFLPKLSASGMGYYNSSDTDMKINLGNSLVIDPSTIPLNWIPIINNLPEITIPDINFNLNLNNSYMAGINLEQPIYMGGKITSAYKMSKIGSEIAELNKELTETEIILETDRAYWLCVQALELYKSAEKYKEVVEEFHRVVKNACDEGMKSKNDLMKVQVQLNQAELQLHRAENGVRLSKMNLCYIIGIQFNNEIVPQQMFNEQLIDINPEPDVTYRPEYSMLSRQIDLKEQEKIMIKSDFMPNIGVRGSYNYIYGVKLNNDPIFNNGSFSAMFSVKIPLFHWGEGSRKIQTADIEKTIIELQREDISEKMNLEIEKSLNTYKETLLEVELTYLALQQSEENLKMSQDYYEAGMETISDYLEAQTIWQNANAEYITAKAKLEICKTEYLKATGRL